MRTTLSFIWNHVSGHVANVSPLLSSCEFDLHQLLLLLVNFISMLFGAGQIVHSEFLELKSPAKKITIRVHLKKKKKNLYLLTGSVECDK